MSEWLESPLAKRLSSGSTIVVTAVGTAAGSRATAAALTCAGSEPGRAGLLIDLSEGRAPRPSLLATAAARELEERLAVHLPEAGVASRGQICHLGLPADHAGIGQVPAALPIARDSLAVIHLPPRLLQAALEEPSIRLTAVLLRADLARDRPLTALAAHDLIGRGIRIAVLKRPLGWLAARAALLGAGSIGGEGLPDRLVERLLDAPWPRPSQLCYGRPHDSEAEPARSPQQEWGGHASPRQRRGLHRHSKRGAGR